MPVTFTAGYIEVWRDGVCLSRHRAEREAVEAILAHAETAEDGDYEIRPAPVKVNVKRRITGPDAPALGPVLTISSTELKLTLDRPATGPTRIDRYVIERLVGSTWTQIASGLNIFSAAGEYPDTGLLPSTTYQYRCKAVDTTERSSEYSYAFGTTNAGAVNQAPVWQSGTISVSVQAGSSVSISGYCSDPEGDPLSFSKVSASPGNGSITVSTSGVVTTASDDAGSYTLTVRASDGVLTADKAIALTVTAASSGNTWYIETGTPTFNASQVQPGDTVIIRAGTRGPLSITNMNGSASQRITLTNESTGVVTISGSSSFLFQFTNCSYVTVDGSNGGQTYGIAVECATSSSAVTSLIKLNGINRHLTLKNFSVDGKRTTFSTAATPIGCQLHDNTVLRSSNSGVFQQDTIICENFYIRRVAGEGLYVGPNVNNGACPLRNITIRNGLIEDTGREGLQGKSWYEGTNSVHDLVVTRGGRNTAPGDGSGISLVSCVGSIYNCTVTDSGESGIQALTFNGPTAGATFNGFGPYTTFEVEIYNNVTVNSGQAPTPQSRHGITAGGATTDADVFVLPYVYCNTSVGNGGYGVNIASRAAAGFVRNNILLDNTSGAYSLGSGGTTQNGTNLTAGTPASVFVAPETGNYRLSSEQAASGSIGTDISSTDIEGTSRAGTASKGAYEFS